MTIILRIIKGLLLVSVIKELISAIYGLIMTINLRIIRGLFLVSVIKELISVHNPWDYWPLSLLKCGFPMFLRFLSDWVSCLGDTCNLNIIFGFSVKFWRDWYIYEVDFKISKFWSRKLVVLSREFKVKRRDWEVGGIGDRCWDYWIRGILSV